MVPVKSGRDEAPEFLYGTAWKEDRTEELTALALTAGFRGIDTANQRKHYVEAAVGAAVISAYAAGVVRREDLFLQTKFTFRTGQDNRLPYDARADLPTQVNQSFESSLDHLGSDYVDSYLLHGPSSRSGLSRDDWEVWRAMEALALSGRARAIGISNVSLKELESLYAGAQVKPGFVQNRCYARTGWDRDVRRFCEDKAVRYQAFSLLTANSRELGSAEVKAMARSKGRSVPELVFRFAIQVGMLPLE